MAVCLVARREDVALAEAGDIDPLLPLAGEVLTVKACFDVAGWTTHAGSAVLADAPPARTDAPMVSASALGGRDPAGADEHDRVRLRGIGTQQHIWHADDSAAKWRVTRQRRVDVRRRSRRRRRRCRPFARLRHQWLDSHSGGVLRRCRLQAIAGPLSVGWVDPAREEFRCSRSDRAVCRSPASRTWR